jgi:hypothetical protein
MDVQMKHSLRVPGIVTVDNLLLRNLKHAIDLLESVFLNKLMVLALRVQGFNDVKYLFPLEGEFSLPFHFLNEGVDRLDNCIGELMACGAFEYLIEHFKNSSY